MPAVTRGDLEGALPDVRGARRLVGLEARVEVWRDAEGIPHIKATSRHDAFLAQGFVHAEDRLWHMEADRRRAYGRWAECVGPTAAAQDVQMRRLGLVASARVDYAAVNLETRAMLDAYVAGVNAFIETTRTLPIEFRLLDSTPEPWAPWDSLAIFKVRHVEMGTWQAKLWRARLTRHLGPRRTAQLCPGTQPNPMLIVPPGVEYHGPVGDGRSAFEEGAATLDVVADWGSGSNNWALSGSRTASGKPLVAGDPHRALDVPNVYYQNHLACPEFDAIGLSFPGVPGMPHFGHNQAVAWCVTHAMADYQDLYVERFDPGNPRRYAFRGDWREAEIAREVIRPRGGDPIEIEIVATHHGPILLGEPASGHAVAFRYSATAEPNHTFEAFVPMLRARSADEIEASMRPWVDPVNNFVFADVHGTIGYRTRGQVPIRAAANAWLPVPGWDGLHEWEGTIPFEEMPACRNPASAFIATANSRIAGPEYPHYIGLDFAPDFRTRRLVERLQGLRGAMAEDMAAIHADRVSIPARELIEILGSLADMEVPAARTPDSRVGEVRQADTSGLPLSEKDALNTLLAWNGVMDCDSVAATIYTVVRERLMRDLMTPILGPLTPEAFAGTPRGAVAHMTRLKARLIEMIRCDDRTLLPPGGDWPTALRRALASGVAELRDMLGPDLAAWRWGRIHATQPQHPLAVVFPEAAGLLNPLGVPMGGDGETVQAAGYIPGAGFGLTLTSVARYVFDLGDWNKSGWVVPFGASGHPGSPHYADQAATWRECRLVPMLYDWDRIRDKAETHQVLEPA